MKNILTTLILLLSVNFIQAQQRSINAVNIYRLNGGLPELSPSNQIIFTPNTIQIFSVDNISGIRNLQPDFIIREQRSIHNYPEPLRFEDIARPLNITPIEPIRFTSPVSEPFIYKPTNSVIPEFKRVEFWKTPK
jgi:hypothetical protein